MKKIKALIVAVLCLACAFGCACTGIQVKDSIPDKDITDPTAPSGPSTNDPSEKPSQYVTPIVRISVEGKREIVSKEEYLPAVVTLTDGDGAVTLDGVSAGVRGRGNYTWTLPKKGYRIKFDKKQAMLSSYKCKSWALLPNYTDKTLLRNYYAFQVARGMDGLDWATDAKLVELYLNDQYYGVYLLCDQTQVDPNRVNVQEKSTDADTGFLIERDRYAMEDPTLVEGRDYFTIPEDYFYWPDDELISGPLPYVLKSPEYPEEKDYATTADFDAAVDAYMAQFRYIKNYVTEAFLAAYTADFDTFKRLCDENSFVDYFLLDQVTSNYEIDRYSSFYIHKDKGGELVAGPVWDFDVAGGYVDPNPKHELRYNNNWFVTLGHYDREFRRLYADRLQKHSPLFKSEAQKLSGVATANAQAIARNNAKWDIGTYVYPMPDQMFALKTYDAQLDFFVGFINQRVDYLNGRVSAWH